MTSWSARPYIIVVLTGLTAIGIALLLIGQFVLSGSGSGDGSEGDRSAASKQVTARANDFAVAYNTYDVANLADYQKRLKGLLTPKYDAEFVKITDAVFGALRTKEQKSVDAKVRGVAVDSIDDDSAVAIVAVDASITNTDNKAAVLRHFRWRVSFAKTKGEWLINNFESVAPVSAKASPPAPAPTTGVGDGDGK